MLEYHLSCGSLRHADAQLFYEVHSLDSVCESADDPPTVRVLLVMGLAATAACWQPQMRFLCQQAANMGQPLQVCAFDNRGVGRSSSPKSRQAYSSPIMAADALALMDHLGWQSAHICGFSMGTQISLKLAAAAPSRVQSLTLIAAAGGGCSVLPRSFSALKAAVKCLLARTPEQRAAADLKLHFTSRVLQAQVRVYQQQQDEQVVLASGEQLQLQPSVVRQKEVLVTEYVALAAALPPQPQHGAAGQMHAVWNHRLSRHEKRVLATAAFPKLFIHGSQDLVAAPQYARKLSQQLGGVPFVEVPGAHFITREAARQVNSLLAGMMLHNPAATDVQQLWQRSRSGSSRGNSSSKSSSSSSSSCGKLQSLAGACEGGSSSTNSIVALHPHEEHLALPPIVAPEITSHTVVVIDARC